VLPTTVVPVASQVGCVVGYGHDVTGAGRDVLVAAGAHVQLACLVRLDAADGDGLVVPEIHAQPRKAQATSAAQMRMAATTIT
jgi:hypothetical protein